jgi:predicted dehydrogenase
MMTAKLRVLIVGVGSIGERHLRCFQLTGRATLAVCEVNAALGDRVAGRYAISGVFADLDAALAGPTIDAAVIATPAPLHIPLASRLAERGIHLLIEKPLSTSLTGIDRLQQLVTRSNITAAVAYVQRAHPALRSMKEAMDSGRFGRPVQLYAMSGQCFPMYRPAYRETYYADRAAGGGAIQDAITHLINTGEWLVGPIDRLVADADHLVLEGVAVEDTVAVLARHGRVMGSYVLNQHQAPNETTITVVCEQGACRAELVKNRWLSAATPGSEWQLEAEYAFERDSLFVTQAEMFLDAVGGKSDPFCTLAEGVHTLRCNLAMLQSAEQRCWKEIHE